MSFGFSDFPINRRSVVCGAVILVALSASVAATARKIPQVLFICQSGSVKSAVTRELFRKAAIARSIAVAAYSRGIIIEAHLSPALKAALASEGIDPEREPLHKLERADLRRADVTVLFDPLPMGMRARRVHDWTDTGSFNQSFAIERPRLVARINALLDEIDTR